MATLTKRFTQFVLRSRLRAISVALLFTVIPFLNWMGFVVVALVTLTKGAGEGFLVFLWSSLPYVVLLPMRMWLAFVSAVVFGGGFIWLLALLLKRFANWRLVLEVSTLVGLLSVMCVHLYVPDIASWWQQELTNTVQQLTQSMQLPFDMVAFKKIIPDIAAFATGVQASVVIVGVLGELMFGRFLESTIIYPDLWKREWFGLRLHYLESLLLILFGVLAWFNISIFRDLLPVILLPFLLVGVSLVHAVLKSIRLSNMWMLIYYVLFIVAVIFVPAFILLFIVAAMIDTIFNFRLYFAKRVKR